MQRESYVPRTWRTHPLHICPADPFSWDDPSTSACLNWIFFISSLNFSFWSELEGHSGRYGVEWREGWHRDRISVHTGYWSLVAAVDRGGGAACRTMRSNLLFVCSTRRRHLHHRSHVLRIQDALPGHRDRACIPRCLTVGREYPAIARAHRNSPRSRLSPMFSTCCLDFITLSLTRML